MATPKMTQHHSDLLNLAILTVCAKTKVMSEIVTSPEVIRCMILSTITLRKAKDRVRLLATAGNLISTGGTRPRYKTSAAGKLAKQAIWKSIKNQTV